MLRLVIGRRYRHLRDDDRVRHGERECAAFDLDRGAPDAVVMARTEDLNREEHLHDLTRLRDRLVSPDRLVLEPDGHTSRP